MWECCGVGEYFGMNVGMVCVGGGRKGEGNALGTVGNVGRL